jgi:hypothetical protein
LDVLTPALNPAASRAQSVANNCGRVSMEIVRRVSALSGRADFLSCGSFAWAIPRAPKKDTLKATVTSRTNELVPADERKE